MFNEVTKTTEWNGSIIELSTGKIARQADGAVMVKMGNSIVQCTTVTAKKPKEDIDFFPLTVHYQEKTYAAGKIPGGFFKREGKGGEKETLIARLIDRPIRPLFHPAFFNETQILCTVHSFDPSFNTDILALIGASAALAISGVPYLDIAAASRVGLINDQFVLNPTIDQLKSSKLDLVVAGTKDSIMMVESEAEFLTEQRMLEAIKFAHDGFQPIIQLIQELKQTIGKPAWETSELFPDSLKNDITTFASHELLEAFSIAAKPERAAAINQISESAIAHFSQDDSHTKHQIVSALSKVKSDLLRSEALTKQIRIDGRKSNEVRPISCEVSLFPNAHGSALFTRGETQSIVSTTLGTAQDEQIIDVLEGEYKEGFLLNYIFPPYSVGEVGPMRAPTRREIGHGKLAWKALKRSLPEKTTFPYTIRVVSEISESNGSSSMATVCGSSMSMMNAGVPLKSPIAGIAMGLIKQDKQFLVLSDIIADEDHLGDMDFKVAGDRDFITALQMDIKVPGITFEIMEVALEQAKHGRVHILDKMNLAINSTGEMNKNAPMIVSFMISKNKIRDIIGPGGKIIREICETNSAKIDITDDGKVSVSAIGKDNLESAISAVKEIAIDPKIGDIFDGTVVKILDAGAFVNYSGSRDGFLHISEISHERVKSVDSILSEGQKVKVKLIGFERGKSKLTIKGLDSSKNDKMTQTNIVDETNINKPNNSQTQDIRKPHKPRHSTSNKSSTNSDSMQGSKERKYFN